MSGATRCGSIIVATNAAGNLVIAKSHTPIERITIERADVADLMAALGIALLRDAFIAGYHAAWPPVGPDKRDAIRALAEQAWTDYSKEPQP
jgi:hypothetical protein